MGQMENYHKVISKPYYLSTKKKGRLNLSFYIYIKKWIFIILKPFIIFPFVSSIKMGKSRSCSWYWNTSRPCRTFWCDSWLLFILWKTSSTRIRCSKNWKFVSKISDIIFKLYCHYFFGVITFCFSNISSLAMAWTCVADICCRNTNFMYLCIFVLFI